MSSTAVPKRVALHRNPTTDISVPSSVTPSPFDSPRQSPSSTSLSSLASDQEAYRTKMFDTWGNEFKMPDFTIKQIRDAIPPHCFKRSAATSLYYVFRDMTVLASVFYLFHNYVTPETVPSMPARVVLWTLYTFIQGLFGTGLWVLAHECGHQSFSPSKVLNDTVGWICHSFLLVPYFSWKISHGKHHKATGNLARDMVFVPKTRQEFASNIGRAVHEIGELMEETPILTAVHLVLQQLFGWPLYLITNVTGHDNHERQSEGRGKGKANGFMGGVNHFDLASPLYEAKDAKLIALSDLGLFLMGSALYYIGSTYGWLNLLVWYGIPYLWVNHWLGKSAFKLISLSFKTNQCSRHHLPATHRPKPPALPARSMELRARSRRHNRPRFRVCRPPHLPRYHRDPRAAPLCQHDPILQRRRSERGHKDCHGPALPL